jgi:hypothetical protein
MNQDAPAAAATTVAVPEGMLSGEVLVLFLLLVWERLVFSRQVSYDYAAGSVSECSVVAGEKISYSPWQEGDDWCYIMRADGQVGYIPTSFIIR